MTIIFHMEYIELNNKYQLVIVNNPYDIFEDVEFVRYILAETWGMKLRGYKKYFSDPVLPNDHFDFICNHVIICRKEEKLRPVAAVKNVTVDQCQKFNLEFPIYKHLCGGKEKQYADHLVAMKQWVESKTPREVAYSMGFTVEPTLEKSEKRFLCNYIFNLFYFYYTQYNIPNIIHGVSKTFKLDEKQCHMGSEILHFNGKPLSTVKTKAYNDVESHIVIVERFNEKFIEQSLKYQQLWDERIEILGDCDTDSLEDVV